MCTEVFTLYIAVYITRHHLSYAAAIPVCTEVYYDLATFHRQKFTNFLRMDVDDYEELFRLVEPAMKKKTNRDRF